MLDPSHSGVYFQVRHLGLSNVRGTFKAFDATLEVGDTIDDVRVTATVQLVSVDTNQPDRDAHLRGTGFFNADEQPQMTFRSTSITPKEDDRYVLIGDLTLNGTTRSIQLDVELNGTELSPTDDRAHVGFTASAQLRRSDFGIDFNLPLGVNKVAIGETVKIDLDIQFIAP
jgi:polyisoprenoid-binding protein YceI